MEHFERTEPTDSMVNIKEYFYLFWSWTWLIVLAGLLTATTAFLVSINTTPVFEASTSLLVSAPSTINGADPSALVTSQTMTTTYAQMLLQRPVLQGVIDQLKLNTTLNELKDSVTVDIIANTDLLVVTVDDPKPKRASDIANAIASVFTSRISELQSQRYASSSGGLAKQIIDMDQQISTTNSQITAIEQRLAAAATQTRNTIIPGSNSTPQPTVVPNAADTTSLEQLQARLTQYRTIYSDLVTSYEQVRLSEDQTSTNVIISEPADVPSSPVRPRTTLNTILALLGGMLLAASVVFGMDKLDDSVRNPDQIRKKFNLGILGMIASHEAIEDKPITLAEPRSPAAEAFRALRTNLTFAAVDKPLRRIMVTSPNPQDGKTTVSANLALVLAQGDKKVVLIDADLRRPQIHRKFGLLNHIGLTDLFVQPWERLPGVIQVQPISNLGVITSGPLPPNPAELLTSQKLSQILDQLGENYDLILVDSPPVLAVTDASALATAMDGVIVVVKPGSTKLDSLKHTLDQLKVVNARVLGIVLNEVNPRGQNYGFNYSGYYLNNSQFDVDGSNINKVKEYMIKGKDYSLQDKAGKE